MTASVSAVPAPVCSFVGPLEELRPEQRKQLLIRVANEQGDLAIERIRSETASIIRRVRTQGDAALVEMAEQFDNVQLESLEVPRREWIDALDALDAPLRRALEHAARNIEFVHRAALPDEMRVSPERGVSIWRRPTPLARVGVYAPGGLAAYPSSLLMGAVPARAAGVGEIIVCSPPTRSGRPSPIVLAAAQLAGVDRVFAIGGAGAIAAMAYGTASVPRVDRIVGPGSAYVAEAKLQVVNKVAIDSPAGPSEVLVLADDVADSDRLAHELLAQAEHDPDAACIALVTGADGMAAVRRLEEKLQQLLSSTPRESIARAALRARGALLAVTKREDAVRFANEFAAEHVLLAFRDKAIEREIADALHSSGTVFMGDGGSVAFGDYVTGANHVLPTSGLARCYSGLSTLDFVRWTTYQQIDGEAATRLYEDTVLLAHAEGLPAHGAAAMRAAGVAS